MPTLGPWELIIVLLIVVVIFGAGRLSEIGGALGKGIREFRSATKDESGQDKDADVAATTTEGGTATSKTASAGTTSAPASGTAAENKCPSCGTVNPTSQTYCGQCGARLTKAA